MSRRRNDPIPASHGDDPRAELMHIGEVAARTDLSLRSLRHWEEVGLVLPSARTDGGFRLYAEEDVQRILVVRRMKPLGFSLDEMRSVMTDIETLRRPGAARGVVEAARSRLDAVHAEAGARRLRLVRQVEMADEFIAIIESRLDDGSP